MHSVWAITKNTLAQALRMKVAGAVIVLLAVLLPLMSVVMQGDGTLLGKLQTFVSYGLGLVNLLLCLLTIAVAAFTLSNDLKRRHLYLVVTKPVARYQVIVGKLLGILLLNVVLLGVFGGVIYGCTWVVYRYADAADPQRQRVAVEFFTARSGLKAQYDQEAVRKSAEQRFKELQQSNQLPRDMSQVRILSELMGQERMVAKACPPGQAKRWDFDGIRLAAANDPNALIFIRYKLEATAVLADNRIYGMWRIGDLRQLDAGVEQIVTPIFQSERDDVTRTYHEFAVPAQALAEDGYLGVAFFNNPSLNPTTVILEDVEVLFQSGTFTGNFLRALAMIYVRLAFLTALGVSLTTWLSFPVAILVCLAVFFAGLTNTFILESFDGIENVTGMIYNFTLRPLLWMIPKFDGLYNPSTYVINGRLIEGVFLLTSALITVGIKGLAVALFGMWVFSRREIAKAVV